MYLAFSRYMGLHIFGAKTRQHLLFIALVGLFISSFALIVLQSTMGGLQHGLIARGKGIDGHAVIIIRDEKKDLAQEVLRDLKVRGVEGHSEYEIELLAKNDNRVTPIIFHAVNPAHYLLEGRFAEAQFDGLLMATDLAYKLKLEKGETIQLISPGHIDVLLGEIPRYVSDRVSDFITTDMPEKDPFHIWGRLTLAQNLIRERAINRVRVYDSMDFKQLKADFLAKYQQRVDVKTWEEQNTTLLGAFLLETNVMVCLFVMMTLLVSLAIMSGLIVFFRKIYSDLVGMWILGCSKKMLSRSSYFFLHLSSASIVFLGVLAGVVGLMVFDSYALEVMPDIFVDRRIPIRITLKAIAISFLVPYGISVLFGSLTLARFGRSQKEFLSHIRSIG